MDANCLQMRRQGLWRASILSSGALGGLNHSRSELDDTRSIMFAVQVINTERRHRVFTAAFIDTS